MELIEEKWIKYLNKLTKMCQGSNAS